MRFKKIMNFFVIFFIIFSVFGLAGEVNLEKARFVAKNWLFHNLTVNRTWNTSTKPLIIDVEVMTFNNQIVGYNFIISPKGNIIVPFRDELPPVKLYSKTSTLRMAENSDVSQWICEELYKINQAINAHAEELRNIDFSETTNGKLWGLFSKIPDAFIIDYQKIYREQDFLTLDPLLSTTWSQGNPYNYYTPDWFDGRSTYTGCVATAAAQVMKYWNHPKIGQGSTSYNWNNGSTTITLSQDFSTRNYDWGNMLNSYGGTYTTAQRDAIAKLMVDVGYAYHMNYGPTGSGASTTYGTTVFPTYFKYKNTIQSVYRSSFPNDNAWMLVFKNEIQNGRPCTFRIRDPNAGGHSVVIDGYQDSPLVMVHINMGWGGSYDGWYATNNIVTGGYNWSDVNYQAAVIGIEPVQEYVLTGYSSSFVHGTPGSDTDVIIYKLNSNGSKLWSPIYGGIYPDSANSIQETSDGRYIVAGTTESYTYGNTDFAIYKLNSNGNKVWFKHYGGTNADIACSIKQTSDGGCIVAGSTESYTYGNSDFAIFKLDSNGNKVWFKHYGGTNADKAHSIQPTSDGGYIVAGTTESYTYGNSDFAIYKLNSNGNKVWFRHYGGTNADIAHSIQPTSDGGYIVAGTTESYTYGNSDFAIYKLDISGNKIWYRHYGGIHADTGYSIEQTPDKGYFFAGESYSYCHGTPGIDCDVMVYKLNSIGIKEWSKIYGGVNKDGARSID